MKKKRKYGFTISNTIIPARYSVTVRLENFFKMPSADSRFSRCVQTTQTRMHGTLFFLLVIAGFSSACSSASGPKAYVRKDQGQSRVTKVAVLSFYNHTKSPQASKIVTSAFIGGLFGKGKFQVEFPGNIRSLLIGERIIVRTGVDLDAIKLMARRLGVDAVILGEVEEYVGVDGQKRTVVPVVSISSRMVDARTGKILWMAHHKRTGDDYISVLDFGKVRSAAALTKKVVHEMIDTMP